MSRALAALETARQWAHLRAMTKRATKRPAPFTRPAHWTNEPAPAPRAAQERETLSPTRYGDWVKDGIAIDF